MPAHPLYDRAALYEAAFSWDPSPEADFYGDVLGPGRLLDVGCGTGRVLGALAARGRDVVGLELSEPMAARARARGLDVVVGDMRDFRLDRPVDGAFSHLSTWRYLISDDDVTRHLDAMAAALPSRGARYAIDHDLVGPDFDADHPGQTWTMRGPDGVEVTATWRAVGAPRGGVVHEECVFRAGGPPERAGRVARERADLSASRRSHGEASQAGPLARNRADLSASRGSHGEETQLFRHAEDLRAWGVAEFIRAIDAHGAFAVDRWFEPPFEISAPFRPVPWTPVERTGRVVTVIVRR